MRAEAILYLPWAIFIALSGVLAIQMNGVFVGATWSRDMRNVMLISFAAYITALFAFQKMFGNHGLWAAYHIFCSCGDKPTIRHVSPCPNRFPGVTSCDDLGGSNPRIDS